MSWLDTLSNLKTSAKEMWSNLENVKNIFKGDFSSVNDFLKIVIPESASLESVVAPVVEAKTAEIEELLVDTKNPFDFLSKAKGICVSIVDDVVENSGDVVEDILDSMEVG